MLEEPSNKLNAQLISASTAPVAVRLAHDTKPNIVQCIPRVADHPKGLISLRIKWGHMRRRTGFQNVVCC
jgi:hypothetical protein